MPLTRHLGNKTVSVSVSARKRYVHNTAFLCLRFIVRIIMTHKLLVRNMAWIPVIVSRYLDVASVVLSVRVVR